MLSHGYVFFFIRTSPHMSSVQGRVKRSSGGIFPNYISSVPPPDFLPFFRKPTCTYHSYTFEAPQTDPDPAYSSCFRVLNFPPPRFLLRAGDPRFPFPKLSTRRCRVFFLVAFFPFAPLVLRLRRFSGLCAPPSTFQFGENRFVFLGSLSEGFQRHGPSTLLPHADCGSSTVKDLSSRRHGKDF